MDLDLDVWHRRTFKMKIICGSNIHVADRDGSHGILFTFISMNQRASKFVIAIKNIGKDYSYLPLIHKAE